MGKDRAAWLESLKVGDRVLISSGYGDGNLSLATISLATATQLDAANMTFRRADGRRRGSGGYYSVSIHEPTPSLLSVIRRRKAVDRLSNIVWNDKPDDLVFAVLALIAQSETDAKK